MVVWTKVLAVDVGGSITTTAVADAGADAGVDAVVGAISVFNGKMGDDGAAVAEGSAEGNGEVMALD